MAGRLALRAEVVFRRHDAAPEVPLPDPVHSDARGQRIARIHDPSRKGEAIRPLRSQGRKHLRSARLDPRALAQEIPLLHDVRRSLLGKFPHDQGARNLGQQFRDRGDGAPAFLHAGVLIEKGVSHKHESSIDPLAWGLLQDPLHSDRQFGKVLWSETRFPFRLSFEQFPLVTLLLVPHHLELGLDGLAAGVLLSGAELKQRFVGAGAPCGIAEIAAQFVDVVEERVKLVELALGDRIVLVVVAPCAAQCHAEEGNPGDVNSVYDRLYPVLLEVDAALEVEQGVAVESCRDQLFVGRIG